MFYTLKLKILLAIYIIVVLSIPIGTYLVSQNKTLKSQASETKPEPAPKLNTSTPLQTLTNSKTSTPSAKSGALSSTLNELLNETPTPTPAQSSLPATSFGPTLSFKISIEGRSDFAEKVFVGLMEGNLTTNPKFLLSFMVDVPLSGEYGNLSMAGLNPGSRYTALLKGSAQIATSSAFIMSPTQTKLNDDQPLTLLSGDLNDDNAVSQADYDIALKALGSNSKSQNWNATADLNKDGTVNTLDLVIISRNLGKVGASGVWASSPPATPSAYLIAPATGGIPDELPVGTSIDGSKTGHWIWVPN